jgi:acetyl esterase/lipase
MRPTRQIRFVTLLALASGCGESGFDPGELARIVLSTGDATLQPGETIQLTAIPQDANGTVVTGVALSWSSSNPLAASVSGNGSVEAVGVGDATIRVTGEGKSAEAQVHVRATIASVTVTPNPASVRINTTGQLGATLRDAAGNVIEGGASSWTSADPSIATVSADGTVRGVAVGTVTITAGAGGKSGSTQLTVSDIPIASITVSPNPVDVPVDGSVPLTATARDAAGNLLGGRAVVWTSSNPAVASVGADGRVRGEAVGSAVITASAEGQSGTTEAAVFLTPVATVTISPDPASVVEGATRQFSTTLKDADGNVLTGRPITWSSSATSVATISSSGLATGVSQGTTTIRALSEGQQDAVTLTVTAIPPGSVDVTPGSAMIAAGGGTVQLTATVRDQNGNVLTGRPVTWSSSQSGLAAVSSAGLVTGGSGVGSVTITAVSGGVSGTAPIVVSRAEGTYGDQGYCAAGSQQKMDLYVPDPSFPRPAPVAVFIHGGAWQSGDKSEFTNNWRFSSVRSRLIARGYIVANLNYRLATATSNQWPAQIHDVKCAVKHLRANANVWGVDSPRFGAWGTSAGSHLAAMLGLTSASAGLEPSQHTSQSSRVQAVADLAGPTDLTKPTELNFDYSLVFTSTADSVNASPVNYVSSTDGPFLILHGSNDTVVEEAQATALYNLLQLSGVTSTYTRLSGLDHGFEPSSTTTRAQIAEQIADFFDAHLRGGASAANLFATSVESYTTGSP